MQFFGIYVVFTNNMKINVLWCFLAFVYILFIIIFMNRINIDEEVRQMYIRQFSFIIQCTLPHNVCWLQIDLIILWFASHFNISLHLNIRNYNLIFCIIIIKILPVYFSLTKSFLRSQNLKKKKKQMVFKNVQSMLVVCL